MSEIINLKLLDSAIGWLSIFCEENGLQEENESLEKECLKVMDNYPNEEKAYNIAVLAFGNIFSGEVGIW